MKLVYFLLCFTLVFADHIRIPLKKHIPDVSKVVKQLEADMKKSSFTGKLSANSKVDLLNEKNGAYRCKIDLGTPWQSFELLVDTGSDLLWVPGPNMTECEGNVFLPSKSTTFKDYNLTVSIPYDSGLVRFKLGNETVKLGNITLENMPFGISVDGNPKCHRPIMGLGRQDVSIFPRLVKAGVVGEPRFGIYLNRDPDDSHGGELFLGGYNKDLVDKEDISDIFIDFKKDGKYHNKWELNIERAMLGGQVLSTNDSGLVDTGYTALAAPKKVYDFLVENFNVSRLYGLSSVKCEYVDKLNFTFEISGQKFEITGKDYVLEEFPLDGVCHAWVALAPRPAVAKDQTVWILGMPFLGKHYTVFDYGQDRIAFAPLRRPSRGNLVCYELFTILITTIIIFGRSCYALYV